MSISPSYSSGPSVASRKFSIASTTVGDETPSSMNEFDPMHSPISRFVFMYPSCSSRDAFFSDDESISPSLRPRFSPLIIPENDEIELPPVFETEKIAPRFVQLVESIRAKETWESLGETGVSKHIRYTMQSLSAGTSNAVFQINDSKVGGPIAVFKTTRPCSSEGVVRRKSASKGVGIGIEYSFQNEEIAGKLALLVSDKKIVPEASIVTLQGGYTDEVARTGTIHEYVFASSLKTDLEISKAKVRLSSLENPQEIDYETAAVIAMQKNKEIFQSSNDSKFVETIHDIAVLQIMTVSLDVNLGNIMLDSLGVPISIDYNEIAPPKFEVGIKPPCWMNSMACMRPIAQTTKLQNLNWATVKKVVKTVPGYSTQGLVTMQFGLALLKKGMEQKLTPNEMAYFLIGERFFANAPRSSSAMAEIYEACFDSIAIESNRLGQLLDLAMNWIIENRENHAANSFPIPESHFEKIAADLKKFVQSSQSRIL